jgi:phospholipid/cholesterol/gamma-HCH transport system substrate-binding protein
MTKAIKDHLRDFLAILGLLIVGVTITLYIVNEQRLRIPVIEERPFELKAEMETAQAVTPGQGQTVRVAGVRVGDIAAVDYEDGNAVVTMDIDRKFLPVYRDATILLRPKTGLKDMFLELDPGTRAAGEYDEGDTIPVANTAPDVNLDEVLELLDADTRAYLRLLLVGGGQALDGQGKNLGELLGSLGPINRGLARINREVAKRKQNLANLIHNMNIFFGRLGTEDEEIAAFIDASNSSLSAIAGEDLDVQRATRFLGPTFKEARIALQETNELATVLGPTLHDLRPFVRKLKPINDTTYELAKNTRGDVKDKIRPFVVSARGPVRDLRPAAQNLVKATPRLTTVFGKLNKLFNMAAYNPGRGDADGDGIPGDSGCAALPCTEDIDGVGGPDPRDEGYLYWLGWLSHVGNSTFQNQDAHGVYRRVFLVASRDATCALLGDSPIAPAVSGLSELVDGSPFPLC